MEGKIALNPIQRNTTNREEARLPSRERVYEQTARRTFTQVGTPIPKNIANVSDIITSSAEDLMLASVNIAIDEIGFVATLKSDVLQIQEEINKLDVDGAIRGTNPSDILKKNHIYAMYKYLSKYSQINVKKHLDNKLNHANQCDLENLLKFMSVRNGSEGIRKLYKLMTVLDVMLVKLTEYQIISFLKYDKLHETMRQQLNIIGVNKNQSMDAGINISRFQITQAIVERLFEAYEFLGKMQKQNDEDNKGSFITATDISYELKGLKTLEDLAKLMKSGEHLGLPGEIVLKLLELIQKNAANESKKEIAAANKAVRELEKELAAQRDRGKTLEKELSGLRQAYEEATIKLQDNSKLEELKGRIVELEESLKLKDLQMAKITENHQQQVEDLNKRLQNSEKLREQSHSSTKEFERKIGFYDQQIETLKATIQQSELRYNDEMQQLSSSEAKVKAELKNKISELTTKIEELMKEIEELDCKLKEEQQKNQKLLQQQNNQNPQYYLNLIKEIEKSYSDRLIQLRSNSDRLEKENSSLKNAQDLMKRENQDLVAEIARLEKKFDKMYRGKEDTYENALREEIEMMRKGFETKIRKLQEDVLNTKRERSNEMIELKTNLQREKEVNSLLMRKLQVYT